MIGDGDSTVPDGRKMPPTPSIGAATLGDGAHRGKYVTPIEFESIYEEFKQQHYNTQVLKSYKARSAEVYGEALPVFVEYLIHRLGITAKDTLYDIGSGIGNVVVQIAARTGCRAIGVEVRSDLHGIAAALHEHVRARLTEAGRPCGEVLLMAGDATAEEGEIMQFIAESSIIFMNNVCYPAAMQQKLEGLFESGCSHGTRVVAMKHLFPRGDVTTKRMRKGFMALVKQPWTKITTPKDMFSWTSNSLTFYVYEIDRSANDASFMNGDLFEADERALRAERRPRMPVPKKSSSSDLANGDFSPAPVKKKKKKGPPEGERRFRKPKKSTPREPLAETHALVSSYCTPTAEPNEALNKWVKVDSHGGFYADDRTDDDKILEGGRLGTVQLPAACRMNLTVHETQSVLEGNGSFSVPSFRAPH